MVKRRTSPTRARIIGPGVPEMTLVIAVDAIAPGLGTRHPWQGRCGHVLDDLEVDLHDGRLRAAGWGRHVRCVRDVDLGLWREG